MRANSFYSLAKRASLPSLREDTFCEWERNKPAKDNPAIFISYFDRSGLLLLSRIFLPGKSVNYSFRSTTL